jgi:hypothetical protein
MPHTRGSPGKRKTFTWQYDPQLERITTTSEDGILHTYTVHEIQAILQHLAGQFGGAFFPLANNVAKLGAGTEQPGLGTAILALQPGGTYHAQGASYLGVVLEEAGYLKWNGKHRGIAWRLIDRDFSINALVARLQNAPTANDSEASPIKVVIQCSGSKHKRLWSWQGRTLYFVAHPEFCEHAGDRLYYRPDDSVPGYPWSWREGLVTYNGLGGNPEHLLRAADLFKHKAYRALVDAFGWENTYVLSGGWGLVRADFRLPYYNITFAPSAPGCNRRRPGDPFHDFDQLADAAITPDDTVYFFGGLSYLPPYYELTRRLPCRKVIYYTSERTPRREGYQYIRYGDPFTNWHYSCVQAFVNEEIER